MSTTYTVQESAKGTIEIGQGSLKLLYAANEKLTQYLNSRNKVKAVVDQSYSYYSRNDGTDKDPQASGAYVFHPNMSFPIKPEQQAPFMVVRGPIVDEINQQLKYLNSGD